jgi:hypothetical protein
MCFTIIPSSTIGTAIVKIETTSIRSDVHPGVRSMMINSGGNSSNIDNDDDEDDDVDDSKRRILKKKK